MSPFKFHCWVPHPPLETIGDSVSPASFPSTVGSHLPSHPHTLTISVSNASISAIDVLTSDDIEKPHWLTLDSYYKTYYFTRHIFADVINIGKSFSFAHDVWTAMHTVHHISPPLIYPIWLELKVQ